MAGEISEKYRGRELKLVGVLKGSIFFLTALAREIDIPVKIDFLATRVLEISVRRRAWCGLPRIWTTASKAKMSCWWKISLIPVSPRGICCRTWGPGPHSLSICTLLDRTTRRIVQVPVEFRCFEIDDRFVVGFGLDDRQLYRNLQYLAVMKPD